MTRTLATVAFVTALQGCATSKEVFLSDGSKGFNINCGGALMNFGHCLEKAIVQPLFCKFPDWRS
jgi:hypothetical protein